MIVFRLMLALVLATVFSTSASAEDLAKAVPELSCGGANKSDCSRCRPVYPLASLRNEEQGKVVLAFLIDTDGRAIGSKIVKSSGYPKLDIAARDALAQCPYKPALMDGKPVQDWMQMAYLWTLD